MLSKTNRRTFLKMAGFTGIGAVLAACGQSSTAPQVTGAPSATTAQQAAPTTAPSAGSATLEFWTFNDYAMGAPLQIFNNFIKQFQDANSGIKVNITGKPGTDILAGVVAGAGSGDLPDAIQIQLGAGGDLIAVNALQDMEPYWATMPKDYQGQFNKGALDPCIQNGKVYGLPFSAYAVILFRNLKVLKKAGIDPAAGVKDWADFASQIEKISKTGVKGYGKVLGAAWSQMHLYGGVPGTAKKTVNDDGKSTALKADAFAQLWDFALKIKPFSAGTVMDDSATHDLFMSDQLGFVSMGPWLAPTLEAAKAKSGLEYDIIEVPGQTANQKGTVRGGEFTGMTSTKNKDATWKFISFISDYPQEATWAATIGRLMANDKALIQPDVQKNALVQLTGKAFNTAVDETLFMKKIATGWTQPQIDYGNQVDTGAMKPADAAPKMIDATNKLLSAG
jgi:multiple sugar transport system substrate-binding protein